MSEDSRRPRRPHDDDTDDFGPPLFADSEDEESGGLSFGTSDTGPLPHWTEPPTGEMPRTLTTSAPTDDTTDDLDVWSSFAGKAPVWRDDQPVGSHDETGELDRPGALGHGIDELDDVTARDVSRDISQDISRDLTRDDSLPLRREPGRITIGTDPTDDRSRPAPRKGRPGDPNRGGRPARSGSPARPPTRPAKGPRDLPTAIGIGLLLAIVFIVAVIVGPKLALIIAVIVLGLGSVEYFDKVTEKGYRPATVAGIVACVALPIGAYWAGEQALPLILVLAMAAGAFTFIGAHSVEAAPMPNMAITTLGVVWIGVLGSYAALILTYSKGFGFAVADGFISKDVGTDTLFLLALGVVANDVGALAVGSAAGKTPLRAWISPNKSIEGLIGGTVATIAAMVIVSITDRSTTWNSAGDLIVLGIVVSITAPLGDLTESMFKRNLDVKDFGSIIAGHGGVLDRFDAFLFVLPAAYYLTLVLEPWT
ncbi:MAG TPA: phosphatidate cytidylyltransferase [Ilumatobacteraceae bacterium]